MYTIEEARNRIIKYYLPYTDITEQMISTFINEQTVYMQFEIDYPYATRRHQVLLGYVKNPDGTDNLSKPIYDVYYDPNPKQLTLSTNYMHDLYPYPLTMEGKNGCIGFIASNLTDWVRDAAYNNILNQYFITSLNNYINVCNTSTITRKSFVENAGTNEQKKYWTITTTHSIIPQSGTEDLFTRERLERDLNNQINTLYKEGNFELAHSLMKQRDNEYGYLSMTFEEQLMFSVWRNILADFYPQYFNVYKKNFELVIPDGKQTFLFMGKPFNFNEITSLG